MGRGDRVHRPPAAARSRTSTASSAIGGITSSRCTNEEVYVVQKMVRAAFGNNNVDTCARVCHSPTGYGLKQTFGTSAGTQDFRSVDAGRRHHGHRRQPDRRPPGVRVADEAAAARRAPSSSSSTRAGSTWSAPRTSRPTTTCSCAGHQRRGRQRDRARRRHRGPGGPRVRRGAVRADDFAELGGVHRAARRTARRPPRPITGVPAADLRAAARLYAAGPNSAIYYGLGVTEHSQGSTMVMGMANLAMATGNIGRDGRRRQPAARAEQRAGLVRHGLVPARAARLPARLRRLRCGRSTRTLWGTHDRAGAGPAHPEHVRRGARRHRSAALFVQGEDIAQSDPNTKPRRGGARRRWTCSSSRTCSSTRRRSSRTCSCRGRRSWRRTARSPTPSAGSTGSAR